MERIEYSNIVRLASNSVAIVLRVFICRFVQVVTLLGKSGFSCSTARGVKLFQFCNSSRRMPR
eukprot:1590974-Pyramimonas_sp.AAC.1